MSNYVNRSVWMGLQIVTRGTPLQGIKRFVKIAGVRNLKMYLQEMKEEVSFRLRGQAHPSLTRNTPPQVAWLACFGPGVGMSLQCNREKSTQTRFSLTIRPYLRSGKSGPKTRHSAVPKFRVFDLRAVECSILPHSINARQDENSGNVCTRKR